MVTPFNTTFYISPSVETLQLKKGWIHSTKMNSATDSVTEPWLFARFSGWAIVTTGGDFPTAAMDSVPRMVYCRIESHALVIFRTKAGTWRKLVI